MAYCKQKQKQNFGIFISIYLRQRAFVRLAVQYKTLH